MTKWRKLITIVTRPQKNFGNPRNGSFVCVRGKSGATRKLLSEQSVCIFNLWLCGGMEGLGSKPIAPCLLMAASAVKSVVDAIASNFLVNLLPPGVPRQSDRLATCPRVKFQDHSSGPPG